MTPTAPAIALAIRQHALLTAEQLAELPALEVRYPDAVQLVAELQRRGWLTAYQVEQLMRGDGAQLVLGSYVLLDKLGEGGMGAVFKARHRNIGRTVALKLIRKDRLSPAAVQRFQREVRAAAQVTHPNVVLAYDADQVGDVHFLVMEFVEGSDLSKQVQQRGPLPVAEACEYIRQAALGLHQLHLRGLVHRDIKPANLLRSARDGTIKLLDMGLVRLDYAAGESPTSVLTQEGLVMGTIDFMAPEQVRDAHGADIRADIYSLGCTLFTLLTGRVPFPGRNGTEKMYGHCFTEAPLVQTLRPDVPGAVSSLIFRLMAKSPADRVQTPLELAELLANLNSQDNSATTPVALPVSADSFTGTTPPWSAPAETAGDLMIVPPVIKRRSMWPMLLGSSVLLAVLLILVLTMGKDPEPDKVDPDNTKTDPSKDQKKTDDHRPAPPPIPSRAVVPFNETQARYRQMEWARYRKIGVHMDNCIGMRLMLIPPGEFDCGATEEDLRPFMLNLVEGTGRQLLRAMPKHRVRLTRPYYLGQTEVTVQQFREFVNDTHYRTSAETGDGSHAWNVAQEKWLRNPNRNWKQPGWTLEDNHPVTSISWYDAAAFCGWLSRKEKKTYRLPTEAEWEFACRAGTTTAFHFGDRGGRERSVINRGGKGQVERVGFYASNAFSLVDMHGNALEWCSDWFAPYTADAVTDPLGPLVGTERVQRSSPFDGRPFVNRSDFRRMTAPSHRSTSLGFRVLCEIPEENPDPDAGFVRLMKDADDPNWQVVYNPDDIQERYTVVNEDGEPALSSPGTGRLKIKRIGKCEYYHLRAEVKFDPSNKGKRYASLGHHENGFGVYLQLEQNPAVARLMKWGNVRFDEASVKNGRFEVRNKNVDKLDLDAKLLKEPGQWNVVEIFNLGEQSALRMNGHLVCAIANIREGKPDGVEVPVTRGDITLSVGSGTMFFRRIEMRPILGLPIDFPDSP